MRRVVLYVMFGCFTLFAPQVISAQFESEFIGTFRLNERPRHRYAEPNRWTKAPESTPLPTTELPLLKHLNLVYISVHIQNGHAQYKSVPDTVLQEARVNKNTVVSIVKKRLKEFNIKVVESNKVDPQYNHGYLLIKIITVQNSIDKYYLYMEFSKYVRQKDNSLTKVVAWRTGDPGTDINQICKGAAKIDNHYGVVGIYTDIFLSNYIASHPRLIPKHTYLYKAR